MINNKSVEKKKDLKNYNLNIMSSIFKIKSVTKCMALLEMDEL